MSDLITAFGLVLVIEGLVYAIAPNGVKAFLAQALGTPSETLRLGGLAAIGAGVAIVWLVRG